MSKIVSSDGFERCEQCGISVPVGTMTLSRTLGTSARISLSRTAPDPYDAQWTRYCSQACADVALNERVTRTMLARAGKRPLCPHCGNAATWYDTIDSWECETCGTAVLSLVKEQESQGDVE